MNIDVTIDGNELFRFLSHDALTRTVAHLGRIEQAANSGDWPVLDAYAEGERPERAEEEPVDVPGEGS